MCCGWVLICSCFGVQPHILKQIFAPFSSPEAVKFRFVQKIIEVHAKIVQNFDIFLQNSMEILSRVCYNTLECKF